MTDDSSLSQNRTTLLINHVTSLAARNILEQQTITSESLTTLTNLTMLNNNNNSTSETFTITNFHLNRSTTISNNQVHDIDMMDTTRNNIDTNQFNNKAHVCLDADRQCQTNYLSLKTPLASFFSKNCSNLKCLLQIEFQTVFTNDKQFKLDQLSLLSCSISYIYTEIS
ncbi:unnamed protein product [Rotaria sp. Silwood1]|nr:unnamed protein product [Rotaria sp. Silwood1]